MGVVVGLLLGAGLCLVMAASTSSPRSGRPRGARVREALAQAGVEGVGPGALIGVCAASGLVTGVVSTALTTAPAVGFCLGAVAGWAPWGMVTARARRRRRALRESWPEVVDHLGSAIRAGLALPEALAHLADRGPEELRPAFRAFAEDHRAGARFEDSLDTLKDRLADPVADRIVEALRLTRDVGGTDLGRLLRSLSAFLREDLRTRGELEARQSWTVNAARLAAAAPWVVLLLLTSRPEAAAAFATGSGSAVVLTGAGVTVLAYRAMTWVARLPEDRRVLR